MNEEENKKFSERAKEKADRVKQHILDNKTTYLVGAGCLAAGYFLHRPKMVPSAVINNTVAPKIMPKIAPVINNTVNNGGRLRKIVQCIETGEIWEKASEAAKAAGTSPSYMSRHLNGHHPDVFGNHYKIIGLGTN